MGAVQGIVLAGLVLAASASTDRTAAQRNRDGNSAFERREFDAAVTDYTEAMTHAPESPDISYNLGNALHKNGSYEKAAAALSRAAQMATPELQHEALYNLGNTFYRMGKAPEALEAYKRALRLDPNDVDTKINFEKALQLLKQQQQQDQNQDQNQQQDPNKQNEQDGQQDQNPEGGDQEQQQDQGQQQDEQNQDQQDQGKNSEQGQEGKEEPTQDQQPQETGVDSAQAVPEGQMSPEEALRVLQALRDQEEELQKEKARKAKARARGVEKDW
jgi:tetratricopeptide (TPR) repeat protein